jgi:O-antigen ligase
MSMRSAARLLGLLVVASVVVVDPGGLAPFGPAKWMAVSTLSFAAGASALWNGRVPVERITQRIWLVMLAFITLGALLGGDVPTALLGHPDRHLGLITWLLFLLMFCAGQQVAGDDDRRVVARSAVVAALCVGGWCAWELVAGPPIGIAAHTDRLMGPFGSAAILGASICLLLPLVVGETWDRLESTRWRATAGVSAALLTMSLLGSGSRAAWVGVAIAAAITVVARRPHRRVLICAAMVSVIAIAIAAPRVADVLDRPAGMTSRLDEWRIAGAVVVDHPLIGVGPEGYRIAVSEGIDADYERTYGRERVLPDRAHSAPLDVALVGGVPAALAYLGLIMIIGWRAIRLARHARPMVAGFAGAFLAYAAQQLMLFPLAELDPIWWMVAGIVVTASRGELDSRGPDVQHQRRSVARSAASLVAMVAACVALIAGVLDVAADRLAHTALNPSTALPPPDALDDAERAVSLRPDNVRYRMIAAHLRAATGTLAGIDAAIDQSRRALNWSSRDPIAADSYASFLLERAAITGGDADINAALTAWHELVDRDPVRARWQLQLGRAAALDGDVALARHAWTVAADLAPGDTVAAALLTQLDAQVVGQTARPG